MKSIKVLKVIINILYIGLIATFIIGLLLVMGMLFFEDYLPSSLQVYKGLLSQVNIKWYYFITPFASIILYVFFILSIYYLKKCIKPMENLDFYSNI